MRDVPYRSLPSTDRLLRSPRVEALLEQFSRDAVLWLVRESLEEARAVVSNGGTVPEPEALAARIENRALREWVQRPRRVINATGVILHTNLGRAPLSLDAIAAMCDAASYCDLEMSLESGERDSRQAHLASILGTLTGAEAAHVTSNAAGAVLLALTALARGKEVIVSRGQAVEIGGGFRIPSVLRQSGARLIEVGTTNRTRISDYADAITPRTAAILHVHTSNFRVVGFTESVPMSELSALAHRHGLLVLDDNGSGSLLDTGRFGLAHEPTPVESLQAGADIVAFSGDKLLGGPQAGILLGHREYISKIGKHPLARAVRPDKGAIAALRATLLAYVRGDAEHTLPVWKMIAASAERLAERTLRWIGTAAEFGMQVETRQGESTVGGGSLPGGVLPTTLAVLPSILQAEHLRQLEIPVLGRTVRNRVLLDPRTVLEEESEELMNGLRVAWMRNRDSGNTMVDSAT